MALEARIAALEALLPEIPSSGIILWDSTSTCPTGYTAVTTAYVGSASLDNSYLRATSGAGGPLWIFGAFHAVDEIVCECQPLVGWQLQCALQQFVSVRLRHRHKCRP